MVGGQSHAPAALPPRKKRYPNTEGWLGPWDMMVGTPIYLQNSKIFYHVISICVKIFPRLSK